MLFHIIVCIAADGGFSKLSEKFDCNYKYQGTSQVI
jgi:hypothetical protein